MKVHHPVEFLAATLTASSGSSDDVVKYVNTCREMKIPVLPPDVNTSELSFTPDGGRDPVRARRREGRRRGRGRVRPRRRAAGDGPFRSLTDFCSRVDLRLNNRRVIEALVKSGCFDSLGKSARRAPRRARHGDRRRRRRARGRVVEPEPPLRRPEGRRRSRTAFRTSPRWSADEKIRYEKETLGFYITGHPLARFEDEIRMFGDATCETLHERLDAPVKLVGLVVVDQEEPDQEGPERGEDDGEGRRRGPHGVRARHGLREPARADQRLVRAREGRPRDGDRALLDADRAAAPPRPSTRARTPSMPIEVIAREIQPLEGMKEQGARHVVIAPSNFDTFDEKIPRGDSQKVPRLDARLPRNAPVGPVRGAAQALVGILGPADAGIHGVDGDSPRAGLRPLRLRAVGMTTPAPERPAPDDGGHPDVSRPDRRGRRPPRNGDLARRRSAARPPPRAPDEGRGPRGGGGRRERARARGASRVAAGLVAQGAPRALRNRDARGARRACVSTLRPRGARNIRRPRACPS